jgi:hypothetical protein
MLWINHAPALIAVGGNRKEFYKELFIELNRFKRRLQRERKKNNGDTMDVFSKNTL